MFCSILISNFNKSRYIKKCLNSLINQTYQNFEVIFCDNESTDNSLKVVSKFKNVKILNTRRLTKSGPLNQINALQKAFDNSNGEYIFLLDSDDFFEIDKLKEITDLKKKNNYEYICDVPKIYCSNHKSKKFKTKSYFKFLRSWPVILPTSSISFSRNFYLNFKNFLFENKYNMLEIDFRLNIYANIVNTNNFVLENNLTNYNQTSDGIMSKYRKFDKKWWKKRLQAHNYLHNVQKQVRIKTNKNLDYYVTRFYNSYFIHDK